jgi:hypothetical protein
MKESDSNVNKFWQNVNMAIITTALMDTGAGWDVRTTANCLLGR